MGHTCDLSLSCCSPPCLVSPSSSAPPSPSSSPSLRSPSRSARPPCPRCRRRPRSRSGRPGRGAARRGPPGKTSRQLRPRNTGADASKGSRDTKDENGRFTKAGGRKTGDAPPRGAARAAPRWRGAPPGPAPCSTPWQSLRRVENLNLRGGVWGWRREVKTRGAVHLREA